MTETTIKPTLFTTILNILSVDFRTSAKTQGQYAYVKASVPGKEGVPYESTVMVFGPAFDMYRDQLVAGTSLAARVARDGGVLKMLTPAVTKVAVAA